MPKTIKNYLRVVIFLFGAGFSFSSSAQKPDSLDLVFSTGVILTEVNYNPFYLTHNQWGAVSYNQNIFLSLGANFYKVISENWSLETKVGIRNEFLYEAYAGVNWKKFSLYGGRKRQVLGGIENNNLSTGSLALGNNSLPIPQIGLDLDYFSLPFSHGYVKLKGGISHGWFEKERYISKPLLHQKYAKVLIDFESLIGFRIYSSIIHSVQYGGISPLGDRQPSSFDDFIKVFFGQGIPNPLGGTAGESNAVGNHVGITEFTLDKKLGDYRLSLNYQKPFEDQGSMQYLSFKDFLVGIRLKFPEEGKVKYIYFEWIRTMSQSGPGFPDPTAKVTNEEENYGYEFGGRDDYYNNWLYQTGWTYQDRILSNPLFSTYNWALNFLPLFPNYGNQVINNRINAFHIGVLLEPREKLSLRTMFTYALNYGTYAGLYEGRFAWNGIKTNPDFDYVFLNGKNQFYSLIESSYQSTLFKQPVRFKMMLATDLGELYNNVGAELSVEFMLK